MAAVADLRPLRGLRYQAAITGDLGSVLAPPYDVISEDAQRALYERGPYNVVRLEYGAETVDGDANRYQTAAATLAGWRREGALAPDNNPCFYLYEQHFQHDGQEYRRRSIVGRVRLEPWDAGVVLPHEHTMAAPKQDRLRLLRACRTDVSPVFALYRPDGGESNSLCERAIGDRPAVDAVDSAGQRHRLWPIGDPAATGELTRQFASRTLYVADGHHRYETALSYRDERRAASRDWDGEEPENFVLMALTSSDDPGLLILPIHRLVRPLLSPENLNQALSAAFDIAEQPEETLAGLVKRLASEGSRRPAFCRLASGVKPTLMGLRDRDSVAGHMPPGHAEAWQQLSVNVLQYGVLEPLLGI